MGKRETILIYSSIFEEDKQTITLHGAEVSDIKPLAI